MPQHENLPSASHPAPPQHLSDDAPLRHDVRFLADLFGEVLHGLGAEDVLKHVQAMRACARQLDARPPSTAEPKAAHASLQNMCSGLPTEAAQQCIRAFTAHFSYINVAEQTHRVRRRRFFEDEDKPPQRHSLRDAFMRLKNEHVAFDDVMDACRSLRIVPVFTAHPTEPTRQTLLRKQDRLMGHLLNLSQTPSPSARHRRITSAIASELASAWLTEAITEAPTVAHESEHVCHYVSSVLFDVAPEIGQGLADAVSAVFGRSLPDAVVQRPMVSFGTWVGGDMDGHPNVHGETLLQTVMRQRAQVLKLYRREVHKLLDHLSQTADETSAPKTHERLKILTEQLSLQPPERHGRMPYRLLLHHVVARLDATQAGLACGYGGPKDFIDDLEPLRADLKNQSQSLVLAQPVERLLRRIDIFGFHLAALDVRQDAWVHREAVGALLGDPSFQTAPVYRRVARLEAACRLADEAPEEPNPPVLERSLGVMRSIAQARKAAGEAAVGPYIISMAQDVDDVLAVMLLALRGGLQTDVFDAEQGVTLDIAPLFETVPDLERAGATLAALLENKTYRAHLKNRDDIQHVMLGYSDSNKASGLVASRWALQQAQRTLSAVAESYGITLVLFHGRGGTASRGGSQPREAVFAEPHGTLGSWRRHTEQGETLHHKYGHPEMALRSLELLGGGILEAKLSRKTQPVPEAFMAAMALGAGASRQAYEALCVDTDAFFSFFRAATPIDAIGRLRIGSRPAARRSQTKLADLRAIPWVFAWTQSRMLLPNWFGVAEALEAMQVQAGIATVREMYVQWPFFKTLINDAAAGLAVADMATASMYAALAEPQDVHVWQSVQQAYLRSEAAIHNVMQTQDLLDHAPVLARALKRRNPVIKPLHVMQVDLLRRWREAGRPQDALEHALLLSVKGVAQGLLATG